MTARRALAVAAEALVVQRRAAALAVLAGAAAGLAGSAGSAAAARLAAGGPGRAVLVWLAAALASALLAATGLSAAVAAARGNDRALLAAPGRGVAILVLRAVERTILVALLLAALAPSIRFAAAQRGASATGLALAITAACAGPLLLAIVAVPAFQLAIARTADGEAAADALAAGVRAALRRYPVFLRLLLAGVVATAPFWLLYAALGRVAGAPHSAGALALVAALRGAIAVLLGAWIYGALLLLTDEQPAPGSMPPAP